METMNESRQSRTALLVIDVQRDVVANAHGRDLVLRRINALVEAARAEEVPVIWVQHDDEDLPRDSDGWQLADELDPLPHDPIVFKNYRDSFEQTTLAEVLAENEIGRLVLCGAQTDACVRWTLHGAMHRGFDTVLVGDAHTTDDLSGHEGFPTAAAVIRHTNAFWGSQTAPGRATDVVLANNVDFHSRRGRSDAHR